jgi:hypothetical protein
LEIELRAAAALLWASVIIDCNKFIIKQQHTAAADNKTTHQVIIFYNILLLSSVL